MSTRQLLAQLKAMPAPERRKFLAAAQALELDEPPPRARRTHVIWPDVEARAKRIFGDRVLPNLVLRARADERY